MNTLMNQKDSEQVSEPSLNRIFKAPRLPNWRAALPNWAEGLCACSCAARVSGQKRKYSPVRLIIYKIDLLRIT
jgi:hypothetical protein